MDEAKSIHTPVDTSTKLVQAGEEDSLIDQSLYRLAVGSLMYLSTATRPDIPYAVNNDAHGSGLYLFAGLDHWTGLLDWTTGLTFDLI